VYCVDLFDNVGVPATYNATVTTDGFVNNQLVDNAGQVAWLLDHYATTGQGVGAVALQAAIWHVIYNGSAGYARGLAVALDSSSPSYSTYTAMLSALGNQIAPLSDVDWLTPTPDNLSQGLVAATPVPEPATVIAGVAMLLPFGVSVLRMLRRKEAA
jgi:hypothetical protein